MRLTLILLILNLLIIFCLSDLDLDYLNKLYGDDLLFDERQFLIRSANQPGTIILPSGLQYRILSSGRTIWENIIPTDWIRRTPNLNSYCICHYTGRNIRGKVFKYYIYVIMHKLYC